MIPPQPSVVPEFKGLFDCLRDGNRERLAEEFSVIVSSPDHLESRFENIKSIFVEFGQSNLFLDYLLSFSGGNFHRLGLVAKVFETATALGRQGELLDRISAAVASGAIPRISLPNIGYASKVKPGDDDFAQAIRILKYGRALDREQDLFQLAERAADRVELDRKFLDYLYEHSRLKMPRSDWERTVLSAFCLDHIIRDFKSEFGFDKILDHVDRRATEETFKRINDGTGMVLMTFHGAFVSSIARQLFNIFAPGGASMESISRGNWEAAPRHNPRLALFVALRVLMDKRPFLIAPDGRNGKLASSISVLGRDLMVGDGAAFLAYEAKCQTAWFTVVRGETGFVPLFVPGPRREEPEKFNDFKDRLLDFYQKQIEAVFSGDPRNIVPGRAWMQLFGTNEVLGKRSTAKDKAGHAELITEWAEEVGQKNSDFGDWAKRKVVRLHNKAAKVEVVTKPPGDRVRHAALPPKLVQALADKNLAMVNRSFRNFMNSQKLANANILLDRARKLGETDKTFRRWVRRKERLISAADK